MIARYKLDKKERHAIIETDKLKCNRCPKVFEEEEDAFFATGSKEILCSKCVSYSEIDCKINSDGFRPGKIKEVTE